MKYTCPYCHEKEVEEINACGSSSYFCNHCKKLVSNQEIKKQKEDESKEDK